MFNPCISLKRSVTPNFLYYIFVVLYVLHVILENNKNIISRTSIILLFSAHASQKNRCLRRWKRDVFTQKCTSMVFDSLQCDVFSYIITR